MTSSSGWLSANSFTAFRCTSSESYGFKWTVKSASVPPGLIWPCPSPKPGRMIPPSKRCTSVPSPIYASASNSSPTKTNLPSAIAAAFARGCFRSTVYIFPYITLSAVFAIFYTPFCVKYVSDRWYESQEMVIFLPPKYTSCGRIWLKPSCSAVSRS